MLPQSVALQDSIKPEILHQAERARVARKQSSERVDLARRAQPGGDAKKPLSLEGSVKKSNTLAEAMNSRIRFKVDDSTDQVIVQVVNRETDKVIRQFPSEEMIKLASRAEELRGLIYNNQG